VLLHQLGEYFVLSCQLGFELLDTGFFSTFLWTIFTDKCCCSVLEKLLLPDVEM
jgi:hypothetical protein